MKLIHCNGKILEVRDVGQVLFRLTMRNVPIYPAGGYRIVEDGAARAELRSLIDSDLYDGGKVDR